MIRVFAVHNRPGTRTGVLRAVTAVPDLDLMGQVTSAEHARRVCGGLRPRVVTVDAMLPDGDGVALAGALRDTVPEAGVVMFGPSDRDLVLRAIAAGVSSYLIEGVSGDDVVVAIRHAALATSSFSAHGIAGMLRFEQRRHRDPELSRREHEVFRLLRQGCGVVAIAQRLDLSESTVKTYLVRIRRKLRVDDRSALRRLARS